MSNIVSKHLTRKRAEKKKIKKMSENRGRSSGWKRIDYTVVPIKGRVRKWGVRARSI